MDKFRDTVNDIIFDDIQIQIGEHLFGQWYETNLSVSDEYADFLFFAWADQDVKDAYNKFYGYTERDEFYL